MIRFVPSPIVCSVSSLKNQAGNPVGIEFHHDDDDMMGGEPKRTKSNSQTRKNDEDVFIGYDRKQN